MAWLSLLCRTDRAENDETTLAWIAFVENAARAEPKIATILPIISAPLPMQLDAAHLQISEGYIVGEKFLFRDA